MTNKTSKFGVPNAIILLGKTLQIESKTFIQLSKMIVF